MGRPIKSSKIGSGAGKIQVTNYRLSGEIEVGPSSGTAATQVGNAHIVSQRSTRKFKISAVKVSDSSTVEEVLTLVNKAAGSLDAGEFRISVVNPNDSSVDNASKLTNRTVVVGGIGSDASAPQKFKYTVSDTAPSTPQPGAAIGSEAFDATSVDTLGIASVDSN